MTISELKEKVISASKQKGFVASDGTYYPDGLPYLYSLIDEQGKYKGWCKSGTFPIDLKGKNGEKYDEESVFLLFVLAIGWTALHGRWRVGITFTKYVKDNGISYDSTVDDVRRISAKILIAKWLEKNKDFWNGKLGQTNLNTLGEDYFFALEVLLENWSKIKNYMDREDWEGFYANVRQIKGLGGPNRALDKKLLLIMRELRCQGIFDSIPGELCCVADTKVRRVYEESGWGALSLDSRKASQQIYQDFGDLYDIAAFAYEDVK